MKAYVKPQMTILPVSLDENIAASSGICAIGRNYSANKQECQNCKLYYSRYGSLPAGIDISSALMTFCQTHQLGYTDKASARAAADGMSCPDGKI